MKEFNPRRCVQKEKGSPRPELTGVYHDNGYKIGTDAYIMAIIKSDYPSELEGKITAKDGSVIEAKFPNYRNTISKIKRFKCYSIDAAKFKEAIAKCERAIDETTILHTVRITENVKIPIEKAKLILAYINTYKVTELYEHIDKNFRCILLKAEENIMLCMPMTDNFKKYTIDNQITTKL